MTFWQPSWAGKTRLRSFASAGQGWRRRKRRRTILNRMTEEACAAGLYEGSREDYGTALESARKRRVT